MSDDFSTIGRTTPTSTVLPRSYYCSWLLAASRSSLCTDSQCRCHLLSLSLSLSSLPRATPRQAPHRTMRRLLVLLPPSSLRSRPRALFLRSIVCGCRDTQHPYAHTSPLPEVPRDSLNSTATYTAQSIAGLNMKRTLLPLQLTNNPCSSDLCFLYELCAHSGQLVSWLWFGFYHMEHPLQVMRGISISTSYEGKAEPSISTFMSLPRDAIDMNDDSGR
ncbi:hypothetical protein BJ546DRAFT_968849 [Cryomyces antarcticus]